VSADGRSVLAGSEGPASEIWRVPLPEPILARVTPATRPTPGAAPTAPGGQESGATPFLAVAAILASALAAAAVMTARRRPS
jgi:hypothetical protein